MTAGDMPVDLLWDVASKTIFVLAALYGVLWMVRRVSGRPLAARRGPSILLLQTAHLGPGRSVHLIGVGEKVLLIGSTSQQISLLTEMAAGTEPSTEGEGAPQPFERDLRQAVEVAGSMPGRLRRVREGNGEGDGSTR